MVYVKYGFTMYDNNCNESIILKSEYERERGGANLG